VLQSYLDSDSVTQLTYYTFACGTFGVIALFIPFYFPYTKDNTNNSMITRFNIVQSHIDCMEEAEKVKKDYLSESDLFAQQTE
jgi:hypothetical protein